MCQYVMNEKFAIDFALLKFFWISVSRAAVADVMSMNCRFRSHYQCYL
jgi:hypothetical protein